MSVEFASYPYHRASLNAFPVSSLLVPELAGCRTAVILSSSRRGGGEWHGEWHRHGTADWQAQHSSDVSRTVWSLCAFECCRRQPAWRLLPPPSVPEPGVAQSAPPERGSHSRSHAALVSRSLCTASHSSSKQVATDTHSE